MSERTLVCQCCSRVNPSWHHANSTNSSRFCDVCGSYCEYVGMSPQDELNAQERHFKWLYENGKISEREMRVEYEDIQRKRGRL